MLEIDQYVDFSRAFRREAIRSLFMQYRVERANRVILKADWSFL